MSRHRNVRSMRYSDEYDGYDDVYGHSVEDDYSISPSDAAFMYDRSSRQPQIASFLTSEADIAEEEEGSEDHHKADSYTHKRPPLNDLEETKLRSCLDEVRNVLGDAIPEPALIETILETKFDIEKTLNTILNKEPVQKKEPFIRVESPKPQRPARSRQVERVSQDLPEASAVITVVSSPAKVNVVKGFEVSTSKGNTDGGKAEVSTPRSGSPYAGQILPDSEVDKKQKIEEVKTSSRLKVDPQEQFAKDRSDGKALVHMVVTGHVDAGKSTLMGHLLLKLGHVNSKTMHKYEQESRKLGKQSFMYAWILDETGEERTRGITMDVGQSKFETPTKVVTLLDAPGHKDFIPNMITGAAQADVALLVVDSTRGEFETGFESGGQTREHALLVRSLGVNQLCVVVNKLDTVGWSEERFSEISSKLGAFLKQAGFREREVTFVPCSGLAGENLTERSTEPALTAWYSGPSLLEVIDKFKCPERPVSKPFRLSVSDIFKGTGSGFCVSGRIETGMLQAGDKVLIQPQNESAVVKNIAIDDVPTQTAYAGDYVNVTIANYDQQNINVGYILCDPMNPVPITSKFEARIVIFNTTVPITKGFPVLLHLQCLSEPAVITKLVAQLNKSTGEVVKRRPRCLLRNNNAVVIIETSRPVCLELYRDMKELGRFMVRVGGVTIAAGLVTQIL